MSSRIIITDRNNKIITSDSDFSEYVFEIDTFNVANPFDLTLAALPFVPDKIDEWYGITFQVEAKPIFKGVIQRITKQGEKGRVDIKLSGKNRASILVESYCTSFKDFSNENPTTIIDKLIAQTAFYPQPTSSVQSADFVTSWDGKSDIDEYNDALDDAIRNNKAFITRSNKTEYSADFKRLASKTSFKIDPGDMVFDKINDLVMSLGFDVIYQADGTLFIGDISKKRLNENPQVKHKLVLVDERITGDDKTNVLAWNVSNDTSGLYSSVTVLSQSQNGTNKSATATDSTVLDKKPMTVQINDDDTTPEKEAIRIREDNRISSFNVEYTVSNHFDEVGEPWGTNRTTIVMDKINNVSGELVMYRTTFTFSRQEHFKTELSLSHPRRKALNV